MREGKSRAVVRVGKPTGARNPRPGMWPSVGREVPPDRPMMRGGLLLYHSPTAFWMQDAATIMDHVEAFQRYSRFEIQALNTDFPLPRHVAEVDFELVIAHYSIVGSDFYPVTEDHLRWLATSRGHKVMFAQDEHQYCGHRFWFCDKVGIDTVYTLLEPFEFEKVYGSHTHVRSIRTNLPGYVSDQMVADGERFAIPDGQRPIDIGYRGRPLAAHMGKGAQEKYEIGRRFEQIAKGSGLLLDIGLEEHDRLYGDDWPRFLARCKGVLGVESGVSVFDLDDRVADRYERLSADGQEVALEDLIEAVPLEDKVFYRTISPRHFEAAAMRTCQILFEGRYSGAMKPMVHYIPLRKDFSNFDEVVGQFREPGVRRELTENAYRDLIASERYSYAQFIEDFDRDLIAAGLQPEVPAADAALARSTVQRGRRWRGFTVQVRWIASTRVSIYLLEKVFRFTGFLRRGIAWLSRRVPG